MTFVVGDILDGIITGITGFGAFVKLPDNKTGLVHISEVAESYVKEISDFLSVGDEVKVKVLSIENNKISLSVKQAKPKPEKPAVVNDSSFEDKLAEFLKESNENLIALKRHRDGKRR